MIKLLIKPSQNHKLNLTRRLIATVTSEGLLIWSLSKEARARATRGTEPAF